MEDRINNLLNNGKIDKQKLCKGCVHNRHCVVSCNAYHELDKEYSRGYREGKERAFQDFYGLFKMFLLLIGLMLVLYILGRLGISMRI